MSNSIQPSETEETTAGVWPRKLNSLLIGVGILVFGFIIANRIASMFAADELPSVVDVERSDETNSASLVSADSSRNELHIDSVSPSSDAEADTFKDTLSIDAVFGSPLVFVSASEPAYVITENNLRIDVGAVLSEDMTLAGVTGDKLILDKAGDLLSIPLPDPDE